MEVDVVKAWRLGFLAPSSPALDRGGILRIVDIDGDGVVELFVALSEPPCLKRYTFTAMATAGGSDPYHDVHTAETYWTTTGQRFLQLQNEALIVPADTAHDAAFAKRPVALEVARTRSGDAVVAVVLSDGAVRVYDASLALQWDNSASHNSLVPVDVAGAEVFR